eukprot:6422247-Prorocentrum_lima.AAC.1
MVIPSLGRMPVTLHFQGALKASITFFTIDVDPNVIISSTYTVKKPTASSHRLDTTFHTFLE